ncbi:MbtH family protein [Kitasatospora sp. NPDC057965]|uniref:MbtH family protein n=1 Tax=Kitasatospora sp. NPDC057965 TaxID=3346291 RepID=UPI0036DD7098
MSHSPAAHWTVLVNDEDQHALHPAHLPTPAGWHPTGFTGTEDACASWTDTHWADLRPLSLRPLPLRPHPGSAG